MKKDIFDYRSYKSYLRDLIHHQPGKGFGFRTRVAEAIGCRSAYVSQVLQGSANLSLEQAEALNAFLGHTAEEGDFFLLLIQQERAGSQRLRERWERQIRLAREKRLILKDRVDIKKSLTPEDQATYYSSWHYAAIHILITIERYRAIESIAEYFHLPVARVADVVEFLCRLGLVAKDRGRLKPGISRIFLGNDSPSIAKHHTNWRMRAIESLDRSEHADLHLSTVVSISKTDVTRIKEILVKNLEEARAVAKASTEEELHCLALDFFQVF